jgi:hypothetical protein
MSAREAKKAKHPGEAGTRKELLAENGLRCLVSSALSMLERLQCARQHSFIDALLVPDDGSANEIF